jgi:hypothetical protein
MPQISEESKGHLSNKEVGFLNQGGQTKFVT